LPTCRRRDLQPVSRAQLGRLQEAQPKSCNEEIASSLVLQENVGPSQEPHTRGCQSERRKSSIACLSGSLRRLKRSITELASEGPYLCESRSLEGLSPPSEPWREKWS